MRPRTTRGAVLAAVVVALFAAGTTLRVVRAADPTRYTSQDEAAYRALAKSMAEGSAYSHVPEVDPFHWPPAAPAAFAAGMGLAGDSSTWPAYWVQALVSALTMAAAFALARRLGGEVAGVAALAAVALYPPLLRGPGDLLSEPLGALLLCTALAVLVRAPDVRRLGLAGVFLGLLVLARADHLLLPLAVAGVVAVAASRSGGSPRAALRPAAALLAGAALVVVPWSVYASITENETIVVTRGGGSALFVGTYLPGDGTTSGLKRELGDRLRGSDPEYASVTNQKLPAGAILDLVAARRPGKERNAALSAEGRRNLRRYAFGDPLDFGAMMARKAWRMWSRPFSGGRYTAGTPERTVHLALVALALAGLGLGLRRRPGQKALWATAVAISLSTALHAIVVSQPRYNLPLLPALFAAGAAGWALYLRPAGAASPPGVSAASEK